jgi:hypothetical protein
VTAPVTAITRRFARALDHLRVLPEARISRLKRLGMGRSRYRGRTGLSRTVYWAAIANNLIAIAQAAARHHEAQGRATYPGRRRGTTPSAEAIRTEMSLANAAFGRFEDSEPVLTSSLWREVPDDSLVLVDRNFLAAGILVPLVRDGRNRHWMTRAKTTTKWTVLESMAAADDLVELQISAEARNMDPSLPKTYVARAIKYHRKGFQPQTMLTSLTDAKTYPAKDIVGR